MDRRRDGRRDRYLYIIDCLRQEVAFAPKEINAPPTASHTGGGGGKGRRNRVRERGGVWV